MNSLTHFVCVWSFFMAAVGSNKATKTILTQNNKWDCKSELVNEIATVI